WDGEQSDQQSRLGASSSCGSEGRLARQRMGPARRQSSGRSGGPLSLGFARGPRPAFGDVYDQNYDYEDRTMINGGNGGAVHSANSAQIAHGVKGVLARINDALTKLDGPAHGPTAKEDKATTDSAALPSRAPESWDPDAGRPDIEALNGHDDNFVRRPGAVRPGSACGTRRTPREATPHGKTPSVATPRGAYAGSTPMRQKVAGGQSRETGNWRVADSWA
ncbi:unnamed protein product, partial [Polarella glacialis]